MHVDLLLSDVFNGLKVNCNIIMQTNIFGIALENSHGKLLGLRLEIYGT